MEATVRPKRWSRPEYDRMVEAGVFQPGDPVELVNGEILAMTPQNSRHAVTVALVRRVLAPIADALSCHVREEKPFVIDPDSEPEPDLAVVAGTERDYVAAHPTSAMLLVEVADSSLAYDRKVKGPLYAAAGVPEYWIINLADRIVEVYREPIETMTGWSYRLIHRHGPDDGITPMVAPMATVSVADLLP